MSKRQTHKNHQLNSKYIPVSAGGGYSNYFNALDSDSDSDEECPPARCISLCEINANDPIMCALFNIEVKWGDLFYEPSCIVPVSIPNHRADQEAGSLADLWRQSFSNNLSEHISDVYNISALSKSEYAQFMTWLYAHGWSISDIGKDYVTADEDFGPKRIWYPEPEKRKKTNHVPRFCREDNACTDKECRYVHGNTIPKLNKPCAFGSNCGDSDSTGDKRKLCIYIHPGETWTATSVVRRLPTN